MLSIAKAVRLLISTPSSSRGLLRRAMMSTYPAHAVIQMPSLSPTMAAGTIASWSKKVGDKVSPGDAYAEVETDKATMAFEAQEDGYIAKLLVDAGKEITVGTPILVIVEEAKDVAAFESFALVGGGAAPPAAVTAAPKVAPTPPPATPAPAPVVVSAPIVSASASSSSSMSGDRIFASPFARKLAKEKNIDINNVVGSGPNNRVLAADVLEGKLKTPVAASIAAPAASKQQAASSATTATTISAIPGGQDYTLSNAQQWLGARFSHAKQVVPHYYLSIDLDMSHMMKIRDQLNNQNKDKKDKADADISVMDLLVKATAIAIRQVPDVNAAWMDTFIRRYDQVDINVCMGSPVGNILPVLRDVGGKGLTAIASELVAMEKDFLESSEVKDNDSRLSVGTFTIHNLGLYGVKAASPIVLPPQACALALGTVKDTITPSSCEKGWKVTPVMTVTMSCDHRVVDGAVGAAFLQSYKTIVENPISLLL